MEFRIEPYTQERVGDVLAFERQLRREEDFWGWEIDSAYEEAVRKSFEDRRFDAAVSLLAYDGDRVVGRIDASLIFSHFDGSELPARRRCPGAHEFPASAAEGYGSLMFGWAHGPERGGTAVLPLRGECGHPR